MADRPRRRDEDRPRPRPGDGRRATDPRPGSRPGGARSGGPRPHGPNAGPARPGGSGPGRPGGSHPPRDRSIPDGPGGDIRDHLPPSRGPWRPSGGRPPAGPDDAAAHRVSIDRAAGPCAGRAGGRGSSATAIVRPTRATRSREATGGSRSLGRTRAPFTRPSSVRRAPAGPPAPGPVRVRRSPAGPSGARSPGSALCRAAPRPSSRSARVGRRAPRRRALAAAGARVSAARRPRTGRGARGRPPAGGGGVRCRATGPAPAGRSATAWSAGEARPPRHAAAHPDRRARGRIADGARRVRWSPGRGARGRAPDVRLARGHPRSGQRARGAAARAGARLARGPPERRHAPAQRRSGRGPWGHLSGAPPGTRSRRPR